MSKSQPLRLALCVSAVLIAYTISLVAVAGFSEATTRAIVRITAQFGVVLFCGAFMAAPLQSLARGRFGTWLLVQRRALGISFGFAHALHLLALLTLAIAFPKPFVEDLNAVTIIGGGLASTLILSMALTSSDAAQRTLGMQNWRRLHTFGSYFAWVIFTQSYLPRAAVDPMYIPFSLLLLATMALRIGRIVKRRSSAGRASRSRSVNAA